MLSVSSSSSYWQALSRLGALSVPSHSHHRSSVPSPATNSQPLFHCSLTGFRDISPATSPAKSNAVSFTSTDTSKINDQKDGVQGNRGEEGEEEEEEEGKGISRIRVPRQKYIPISKAELLDGIVSNMFDADADDTKQFLLLSSCLDSILHAEHKRILEEMRADYFVSHRTENGQRKHEGSPNPNGKVVGKGEDSESAINGIGSLEDEDTELSNLKPFSYVFDLRNLLVSSPKNEKSVAVATRFQRAFMQLLYDAQFEELSARDLMLTSALNSDYLLTLPIYVDWKKASESNAIIFRRGYATETQKGLLLVEKLDYLQSKLLRGIFFIISKPLGKLGRWLTEAFNDGGKTQEAQEWTKRLKLWLKDYLLFEQSFQYDERTSDGPLGVDQLSDTDLPIWLAAQRAVSRYEGLLSPVGPRGRLLRKLLTWIGLIPPTPETPFDVDSDANASEPNTRSIFLSRISLSDIWRPATRKYCGNDIWKMLKTSISILLSQSTLQEPAFQELILLYTEEVDKGDTEIKSEVPSSQLKIYERIPIPELPVVFPHKKLSFRIIDTVRLDAATIVGLLAYIINYKFENLFSPSAIFLDVVAISALIIYVTRVVLGYKQTWDRYQLLVNRTLYEKTLASGFGSVHFLLDASEQQQYKEAILAYAVMLKVEKGKITSHRSVGNECEKFMYDTFKVKVEMPVEKATNTLLRLGLAAEAPVNGRMTLQAVPCSKAYEALQQRWNSLLGSG
ncbi:uncharacterized protein LOC107428240 isoform X2 [Ziziphus jujuba]|uniref:Uncharacterized protein LOC107428240 isoform X2 n=1 Tax=Ziziphus jujuba TaxID=326968 RepID=A0A6P4AY45_ZIZJJ|nr:uncharacterized protein LOC107428240 isoform X2 [Ziziphus jujuba]